MNKFKDHLHGSWGHHLLTKKLEDGTWQVTTTTTQFKDKVWTAPTENQATAAARNELHQLGMQNQL